MTTKTVLIMTILLSILIGCTSILNKRKLSAKHSEWRDNNGADSCSYYTDIESCKKIIGKLKITSILHKDALEKDVFNGGMSNRWFIIKETSIEYYQASGEIVDEGTCSCENGVLKINWDKGLHLPKQATIYFYTRDFVELRYYDYLYSMNTFQYDTTKGQNTPTKIIGTIKQ